MSVLALPARKFVRLVKVHVLPLRKGKKTLVSILATDVPNLRLCAPRVHNRSSAPVNRFWTCFSGTKVVSPKPVRPEMETVPTVRPELAGKNWSAGVEGAPLGCARVTPVGLEKLNRAVLIVLLETIRFHSVVKKSLCPLSCSGHRGIALLLNGERRNCLSSM